MKHTFWKWTSPFVILGFAILILLGWGWLHETTKSVFLINLLPIILFTVFELIIESAAQANPTQVESPLRKLIENCPTVHDKYVIMIALGSGFLVVCVALIVTGPSVLPFLFGLLAYFGVCLAFGTHELRNNILKTILPEFKGNKNRSKPL